MSRRHHACFLVDGTTNQMPLPGAVSGTCPHTAPPSFFAKGLASRSRETRRGSALRRRTTARNRDYFDRVPKRPRQTTTDDDDDDDDDDESVPCEGAKHFFSARGVLARAAERPRVASKVFARRQGRTLVLARRGRPAALRASATAASSRGDRTRGSVSRRRSTPQRQVRDLRFVIDSCNSVVSSPI